MLGSQFFPQTQHRRIVWLKLQDAIDFGDEVVRLSVSQGIGDVQHQHTQLGFSGDWCNAARCFGRLTHERFLPEPRGFYLEHLSEGGCGGGSCP